MEIVVGYQLLEQLLLLVLYTQIALLLQEQQLHNAKLGDQLVFQMEQLVYLKQLVQHIQHKLLVEMLETMVLVSGLLRLELQQQELADFNYVQMQLQTSQHILDVLHLQLQQPVQPQGQPVFNNPHAHNT